MSVCGGFIFSFIPLWLACNSTTSLPIVKITEFSSAGGRFLDDFGDESDWVEITNYSSYRVKMDGMFLSDSEQQPTKWQFPYITLEPNARIIVFASGRDIKQPGQPLHTNFRINAKGEALLLTTREGIILDHTKPVELWPNLSWGREWELTQKLEDEISESAKLERKTLERKKQPLQDENIPSENVLSKDVQKNKTKKDKDQTNRGHNYLIDFKIIDINVIDLKIPQQKTEDTGVEKTISDFQPKHMGYYIKPSPKYVLDLKPISQIDKLDSLGDISLSINEVMNGSFSGLIDRDGDQSDWIEIKNNTGEVLNLSGYGLTDDLRRPFKWRFPEREMAVDGLILVFASGKDGIHTDEQGQFKNEFDEMHTNFKLRSEEKLALVSPTGHFIDIIDTQELLPNQSFGRRDGEWQYFSIPTPGMENTPYEPDNDHLRINEVFSYGDERDWFELYNPTPHRISLRDFSIGKKNNHKRYIFEKDAFVEPNSYKVIEIPRTEDLESSSFQQEEHDYHWPNGAFQLDPSGEELILFNEKQYVIDHFETGYLTKNISSGRDPIDFSKRHFFLHPTKGTQNQVEDIQGYTPQPLIQASSGFYTSTVTVIVDTQGSDGHYTTDGSMPTISSSVYKEPLHFDSNTVLRVRSFSKNKLPSRPTLNTYFIGVRHDFPVVSLVVDNKEMFHPRTGMYVLGPRAQENYPNWGANFWKDRELESQFEYFDFLDDGSYVPKLAYRSLAGLKIFGGCSRALPKKSLRLISRARYENSYFQYPFFTDQESNRYDSIVLRSSGQDSKHTGFRDVLVNSLVTDLNVDTQSYQPAVVYVNGEYWGLYHLREKINDEFLARKEGVDASTHSYRIITGNVTWPNAFRRDVVRYLDKLDPTSQDAVDWIESQVDIQSFMDWLLIEIFLNNRDIVNVRYWKSSAPNSKWRWILYDLDMTLGSSAEDAFSRMLLEDFHPDFGALFWWLMKNPDMKTRFLERANLLWRQNLHPTNISNAISAFQNRYEFEMKADRKRWQIRYWNFHVDRISHFPRLRPSHLRQEFKRHLQLSEKELQMYFPLYEG
jgi:hypothetical protein